MNSIQTHNLKKHFDGVHAIDGLSIEIKKGTITSIIGPNGSGKSTLVNVLSGVYSIDGGSIVVQGVPLHFIRPYDIASYGMTRTFQEVRLFEQMTVLDNLLLATTERDWMGALRERHKAFHEKKCKDALDRVGLGEKKHALASRLSYGQRKLLEIARVLVMECEIMLFDEPFAGLFPQMVRLVTSLLKDLREHGKTIVLIEHAMDLIRELSDEVIVIDEGKLLAHGRVEAVLKRHDVIEAYLGE